MTRAHGFASAARFRAPVFVLLLAAAPFFIGNDYMLHVLVLIALYSILAESLNVIVGFTGQFSLGHAGFWAIGAYVSALLMIRLGMSFWSAAVVSMAAGYVMGVLLGLPAMRLKGDYLCIVTLGFGEIVRIFATNLEVTRGPMGIPGIPMPEIGGFSFDSERSMYYLCWASALATMYVAAKMRHSRFGRALMSVRDDELAAASLGVNMTYYKVHAFGLGGMFAALAGALYASWTTFISPDVFQFSDSANIFCMMILGGLGTIAGPVLGAFLLAGLPEVLRQFAEFRLIALGLLMIILMIYRPGGILGSYDTVGAVKKVRRRKIDREVQGTNVTQNK
ncbi:MAG: branched-chain amino acid ABC transporter permease [Synergistaceae bacterium]|jgi:branched-chain amino acid transport system permease protein|nr:branched-chain amino acid ABC transporter permease [Synergistaceae bacterium]